MEDLERIVDFFLEIDSMEPITDDTPLPFLDIPDIETKDS